jgi:tRNA dimethylallyltransferase
VNSLVEKGFPPASKLPLIVILGPTAVGKSQVAIEIAERLNGEIISADSRLFYRYMDIGTAKPTREERLRVPHHLIDVADLDETWSLADFRKHAFQAIRDIHQRECIPFLVGGTGQYIRAIIQDWRPPEIPPNQRMRKVLEAWAAEIGQVGLHNRLSALDPQAADGIHPNNLRRTVRALEVILSTGRLFSTQKRQAPSPYNLLLIGLQRPREELYARIDARVHSMLTAGLIAEVKELLLRGIPPDSPSLSAIGYRQVISHLRGENTLDEAIAQIKRGSRNLVRRQANWFKRQDRTIHWFEVNSETVEQITMFCIEWLESKGFSGWIAARL